MPYEVEPYSDSAITPRHDTRAFNRRDDRAWRGNAGDRRGGVKDRRLATPRVHEPSTKWNGRRSEGFLVADRRQKSRLLYRNNNADVGDDSAHQVGDRRGSDRAFDKTVNVE